MRFHSDYLALDKSGPASVTHFVDDGRYHLIHRFEPSTVDRISWNPKPLSDTVNLGASLRGLRDADRVAVVLNYEKHCQAFAAGPVQCLEEFAFACRSFAGCDIDDFVGSILSDGPRHSNGRKELRSRSRRLSNQM